MAELPITDAEDEAAVAAANAQEPNSCQSGAFQAIGAGLSDAARHKLRLIIAWIIAHPGIII